MREIYDKIERYNERHNLKVNKRDNDKIILYRL